MGVNHHRHHHHEIVCPCVVANTHKPTLARTWMLTCARLAVRVQPVARVTDADGPVIAIQGAALATVRLVGFGADILSCQKDKDMTNRPTAGSKLAIV